MRKPVSAKFCGATSSSRKHSLSGTPSSDRYTHSYVRFKGAQWNVTNIFMLQFKQCRRSRLPIMVLALFAVAS